MENLGHAGGRAGGPFFLDSYFASGVFLARHCAGRFHTCFYPALLANWLGWLPVAIKTFVTFNTKLYLRMTNRYGPFPGQRV
jgi:hypothetical protein